MTAFTHNWRIVFITLLLGFIASAISVSAWADAAADYSGTTLHCVTCHGNPGTGLLSVSQINMNYPTNGPTTDPTKAGLNGGQGLAAYISAAMPKDAIGQCGSTACGQEMAHYLRPQAPVADASNSTNRNGAAPLNAQFDASKSNCDNGCSSYVWVFGDGTANGSGKTTSHTYTAAGTYSATLTVTDAQGLTNSTILTITTATGHTPPVINASRSTNLSGVAPLNPQFDASLSTCTGGCIDYEWDFDDNTNVHGVTATHTFKVVGTHIVTLTVFDAGFPLVSGSSSNTTLTVTVSASSNTPVANATKSPNVKGAAPLNAQFDGSKSNCDNTCGNYAWNFGDGTTATSASATASHIYTTVGNYTVTLTVTDASNGKKNSTTLQVVVVPAESLTSYVQACQTQLGFQGISIPTIDCYDGDIFQTAADFDQNASVRDFVGYKRITDQVDAVFACRWLLGGDKNNRQNPISIEMLVNNHSNGKTCFFSAKGLLSTGTPLTTGNNQTPPPPSLIVSPTDSAAASFWDVPGTVDAAVRCINCHISGPYIATPTIAPFLAKNGLINNGHDTASNVTSSDLTQSFNPAHVTYHAISATVNNIPGAFSQWDSLKQIYMNPTDSSCASGCHVVGTSSPQIQDIGQFQLGLTTILHDPANQLLEINHAVAMPPYDDGSDYRWINLSSPVTGASGVETETFANAINATTTLVPKLFSSNNPNCAQPNVPNVLEAHVVGSDNTFIIAQPSRFAFLADRLSVFNLKDGLVCLNSDQESGTHCQDYRVHYECTDANNTKTWTSYSSHALQSDGDHENRPANVCPTGSTATAIEAAFTAVNGWTYSSIGPNDRLASFSQYGLTCNNADQPDGQCSNYVVRYSSCGAPPQIITRHLFNAYSNNQLTAANNTTNNAPIMGQPASGWNTQQWVIEPVSNTEYVRLRNTGTNMYLNVTTQSESALVVTYAFTSSYTSEEWIIEPIAGSTDVRLKNLWSGRYLTSQDPNANGANKVYLSIYSQGRNTSWATQRWQLQ